MPDRREALNNASVSLREIAVGLQSLTQPSDHHLTIGTRLLLDAIDRVDVAANGGEAANIGSADAIDPITVPAISPGTYVRLRREALGLTHEAVVLRFTAIPAVSVQRRAEWLVAIEDDAEEISDRTAMVLHDALGLDLQMLAYWIAIAESAKRARSVIDTVPAADRAA